MQKLIRNSKSYTGTINISYERAFNYEFQFSEFRMLIQVTLGLSIIDVPNQGIPDDSGLSIVDVPNYHGVGGLSAEYLEHVTFPFSNIRFICVWFLQNLFKRLFSVD